MDLPLYFDTTDKIQENIDRKGGVYDPTTNPFGTYDPTTEYFDEDGNSIFFDHLQLPDQVPLISPRVGINWSPKEDLQIRGGSGLFTGRLPFVWIGNQGASPDWFFYQVTKPDSKTQKARIRIPYGSLAAK